MHISILRLSSVLVLGLIWGGAARAGYMDWSYHWSISPAPVFASGTGTVSQALGPGGKGASRILAAAVTTSSSATTRDPDRFNKYFSLTLHIKDLATHRSGNLTFYGHIYGTLTATTAHLLETFRTPTEHLTLGKHTYWVTLPKSLTLRAPGSSLVPAYYATVWVQNVLPPPRFIPHPMAASIAMVREASVPIGAASAPEPSSFVLGGLGLVLLGGAAARRRLAHFKV
jgi:hypothetical protein